MNKHYIIPIFVPHEGCPHDCVFCNQKSITGVLEKVTPELVKETIEDYLSTIDYTSSTVEVSFYGGTFTAIPIEKQKSFLHVAKMYKDRGLIKYIRLSTRPDYINIEILENLKAYSVDIIELGVQSLDREVLIKAGRGHSVEDVFEASKLIKKYGFILGHQIMIGLPGDNYKKDLATTKMIVQMEPSMARIYPALVIKNTAMETMYKLNKYTPYTLNEAIEISKDIYSIFVANDINVIRIGLQPTEEITYDRDLVAGPFHPSFRELVEGSLINEIIRENISDGFINNIEIHINSKDLSKLYAYKKKFFNDMIEQIKTNKISVFQDNNIDRNGLLLYIDENCKKINIKEYLQTKYKEGYFNTI
ncbi:oxygen-independent coproporphyrinogen-III oxidase-like protein HemZ [Clostridium homopropionicum DSM 5847]|uniref:Oxygen-independent coproporphyrinogen-III oxidase-like protein HemZ n=1 Tax=Clostridium homopropionicum DSM 5847 TaxID=1121318 RepID=A0A0L6ZCK0_9CLOT|nr:radical SAM protein [Clostridium homopropionicum]KOA20548.1 oxygen-independent coproporphyrinogen-III oxidase-like protein HemZ [Clostridium homopropionicum DSM 5847]SFG38391.1 Radical SAM superfamily protein [Clostridium homopropionicum]